MGGVRHRDPRVPQRRATITVRRDDKLGYISATNPTPERSKSSGLPATLSATDFAFFCTCSEGSEFRNFLQVTTLAARLAEPPNRLVALFGPPPDWENDPGKAIIGMHRAGKPVFFC